MFEVETTRIDGLGDLLEQPICFLGSSDESYRMLLAALDLGWQVEEPVYFRPRWNEGNRWVFHFILKKNSIDQRSLVTTGQTPEIERLVFEEGWRVDRLPIRENSLLARSDMRIIGANDGGFLQPGEGIDISLRCNAKACGRQEDAEKTAPGRPTAPARRGQA